MIKSFMEELDGKEYRNHRFDIRYKQEDIKQTLSKKKKDILDEFKAWMKGKTEDIKVVKQIIEKHLK